MTESASKEELEGMLRYQVDGYEVNGGGVTALHCRCAGYRDLPHAILRSMFNNINTKDIDLQSILAITTKNTGATPLHYAAQYSSVDVVKLIVQYSPPSALTTEVNNGETPLDWARLGNKTDTVKFLEEVSNIDMQYIIIKP